MNFIRKTVGSLVIVSILASAGGFPSTAFAWHGTWSFAESCNASGKIDVTATYDANDSLGGTVQYTSAHENLSLGDVVTANLVEDNNQHSSYTVKNTENCHSTYCAQEGVLSVQEFNAAQNAGLISFTLSTTTEEGIFTIVNKTDCEAPVSLAAYKMYDSLLSTQTLFDGDGVVNAPTGTTTLKVDLPKCQVQIDAWYGQYPEHLLDTNPYGYPNVPHVLTWGYSNPGKLCKTVTPEPTPVTIVATKIVCDAEADLPNYGNGGPDIGSTTATDFVASHSKCRLVPNWKFQWSFEGETGKQVAPVLPGNFIGEATTTAGFSAWNTFGITDTSGVTSTTISDLKGANKIWVREVLQDGYIPFSYPTSTSNVSAEFYCHTDVLNYDNYEFIASPTLGKTYYCVAWNVQKEAPQNHPPVLSLVGNNPVEIFKGEVYTDAGATAYDQEDGNITDKIVATSTVNTAIVGEYTVTYNVKDSQGLAATPVSRTVKVIEKATGPLGKITFCFVAGDANNVLATSSANLPEGSFSMNLASSTAFGSTTVASKTWTSTAFAPNTKVVSNTIDADCVSFDNLPLGTYYYSELSVNGSLWNTPKYSDAATQPVNSIFDLYPYSGELFTATTTDDSMRNTNSDGQIVLNTSEKERTVVVYNTYKAAPQCVLPTITSPLTASVLVNNAFTYTIIASSTNTISVATSTLPSWLSFATTTNTLSGTATTTGTYNVNLLAANQCGNDSKTLVITVTPGGGGNPTGANISIAKTTDKTTANVGDTVTYTLTVANAGPEAAASTTVTDLLPSTLSFVSASSTVGSYSTTTGQWFIGTLTNGSSTTLTLVATINSGTAGTKIVNTAVASSTVSDPDTTNNTSTVDVNVNTPACTSNCGGGGGGNPCVGNCGGGNGPIIPTTGGNGPIVPQVLGTSTPPKACYYLYDYLKKGWNNNPVEVKKLQVFLRDLEGFTTVQVTGVYDDQTIVALDAFQNRYKADILTPWGHTAPTSFTYILTKKKVNEIYCKMAFPVTAQQQQEIDTFRAFLQGLKDNNIEVTNTPGAGNTTTHPSTGGAVGSNTGKGNGKPIMIAGTSTASSSKWNLSTLAGLSSTTEKFAETLTANALSGAKKLWSTAKGFLIWPFGEEKATSTATTTQCVVPGTLGWINIILILVILVMAYIWFRQYRANKSIEDINKEIDLK